VNEPLPELESTPAVAGAAEEQRFRRTFSLSRMVLPILLGMAAVAYLFYKQFDIEQFRQIAWTPRAFAWIGLALLLMIGRHFAYTLRMRTLTGWQFSWSKCAKLIVLWEFSSALTPTSKGGPFVMLFALTYEKLSAGRSLATVFYTMVCDAGFFTLLLPILLFLYGPPMLYPGMTTYQDVRLASGVFFTTYVTISCYWIILTFFLFVRPRYAQAVANWLANWRLLSRWGARIRKTGDEFVTAADSIRGEKWYFHLGVIGGTLGAWTLKFVTINCLIIALMPSIPVDGFVQTFLYARMVAMFTMMNFSPTPGGAGIAEMALVGFISDYVPGGIALVVALLWRLMGYYAYLLMGAVIAPAWINEKMK
jgi:glycosyltransferase 2 family protein